ncbi:MAG: DNA gyrase subunit A [Candidatus Eisenbacteria sp.]|nr:DNA gyrase subunit A [Candidatus Eisenbacteria bacterium]
MKSSYIDYSMSVIVSRALPDARDGLKPSQRRILCAMNDLNLQPDRPHRKCAKIAGDTSGNYHPHGEQVVYPTLVRMAQNFNMRYVLVNGQGNFGSVDGDPPAAMRYTEARMARPAVKLLEDLQKDTVDFVPNYDSTRQMPTVLPGAFPNLLCNGSSGIAVGMATNIPPNNLNEVISAIHRVMDDPEVDPEELLSIVKGPDFPTGGLILGRKGIRDAYLTGRGSIQVRARANIEIRPNGRQSIVVNEIPYQVSKNLLIEKIADLVRSGRLQGISDLRDESDRDGMRLVIDLKRDAVGKVVLNQLFKHTPMQETFGAILLALEEGTQPKIMALKGLIEAYIRHRKNVVVRRTRFDLNVAEQKAHMLEGLKIALDHIDAIVSLIRKSRSPEEARRGLIEQYDLSEKQAQAILEMRLQRLTGLERKKIEEDYLETIKLIESLKSILASAQRVVEIIKKELEEIREKEGDERRTEIVEDSGDLDIEDLIAEEDVVIAITHAGYIKRMSMSLYRRQRRGGRGVTGIDTREDDFVEHLFIASTHDYLLFFTDRGKCYWLKVHAIPQGGRLARGKAIVNLLEMTQGEKVTETVPVSEFLDDRFLVLATRGGCIKKTRLSAFQHPRRGGIIAIALDPGDALIGAAITDGTRDLILGNRSGKAIRFPEEEVRPMGRTARGVRGMKLEGENEVVGMVVVRQEGGTVLSVTENGYGKRSQMNEYRVTRRGGMGIITVRNTPRNGDLVAMREVVDTDELMIITSGGVVIRLPINGVSVIGRNTQGVRLIKMSQKDKVVDVARVALKEPNGIPEEEDGGEESGVEAE